MRIWVTTLLSEDPQKTRMNGSWFQIPIHKKSTNKGWEGMCPICFFTNWMNKIMTRINWLKVSNKRSSNKEEKVLKVSTFWMMRFVQVLTFNHKNNIKKHKNHNQKTQGKQKLPKAWRFQFNELFFESIYFSSVFILVKNWDKNN